MAQSRQPDFDVLVIGAGVLGVTITFWLSSLFDSKIALADASGTAAEHTSSRNTGVIHRPFYLDPRKKRIFARTSQLSLPMWRLLAESAGLPWKPVGTFNVAVEEREVGTLERYLEWGLQNGMDDDEIELLDGREVKTLEPEVACRAGLLSKTDVSVDFGTFTRYLWRVLMAKGVTFKGGHKAVSIHKEDGLTEVQFRTVSGVRSVTCRLLVNAAGGGALEIAHAAGLAQEFAVLNFRGEYWVVDEPFASRVTSNIYRPPRFPQYPFLDPHFVVRADGSRQIGPNAVIVPGPYVYLGIGLKEMPSLLERPVEPKARMILNSDFLSLLVGEWRSSLSKRAMCERVRKFVPSLETGMLNRRAVFGVRSSVINESGFVSEAMVFRGEGSMHIINYNSPGATGAPAYSAMLVAELTSSGLLDGLRRKENRTTVPGWDFATLTDQL